LTIEILIQALSTIGPLPIIEIILLSQAKKKLFYLLREILTMCITASTLKFCVEVIDSSTIVDQLTNSFLA